MKSALLILALMAGAGPTAKQPAGQAVPPGTTVTGTVTRFGTGEPLADVPLTLYASPRNSAAPRTAVSDREGRFILNDVTSGPHVMTAALDGYFAPPNTNLSRSFTIAAGQARFDDIHFELIQGGAVGGQVLNLDGQPAAELFIRLLRPAYRNGRRSLEEASGAKTDDRGNYRIFSIEPGEYLLSGDFPILTDPTDPRYKLGKTFFPGTLDPASASLLTITPGADLRASFRMLDAPKFTLSGTIINNIPDTNGPATGFFLVPKYAGASTEPPETVVNAKPGPDGRFELRNVQAGSYDLFPVVRGQAPSGGGPAPAFTVQIPVELNRDVAGITAVLQPDVDLKGQIVFDPPLAAAASAPLQLPTIGMRPAVALPFIPGARARIDAKGTFTFTGLTPVTYQFSNIQSVMPDSNAYLADIRQGANSIMGDGFVIAGGDEVQVFVKADGGTVEGTVLGPGRKPASAVRVSLVPDPSRRRNPLCYLRSNTDDKGHFSIHGAAPGDYKIFAWPILPAGADESPEFIAKYEDSGQKLRISPGASLQVEVTLQMQ